MKNHVMTMNYAKNFKRIVILFVILAVVTAVAIPLSLSQQISDAAMLKQQYAAMESTADRSDGEHHHEDDAWKSQITPLSAVNYAIIGGLSVVWGGAGAVLLADRRGVALQERGERGHEQIALADTRDILQRVRGHGFLHRPRPAQEKSRRLKAV